MDPQQNSDRNKSTQNYICQPEINRLQFEALSLNFLEAN